MAKRYSPETKAACRRAYALDNLHLKDIARLHQVPYNTIRVWKRHATGTPQDWDRARRAQNVSEGGMDYFTRVVMDEFVPLLEHTIRRITKDDAVPVVQQAEMCSRLADSLNKTLSSVRKSSPQLHKLGFAMDLLREQIEWARQHQPDLVEPLSRHLEPFGDHLGHLYG